MGCTAREPPEERKEVFAMEDSSPPGHQSPLLAGDLLAESKARLTQPSRRS